MSTHNDVDISEGNEFDAIYSDDKQISDGDSLQPSDCLCSTMQCLGSGLETEKSYSKMLTSMTKIPSHIHLHKTKNKTSSQHTQLGSIAHIVETKKMTYRQRKNHNRKHNKKLQRIHERDSTMSKFLQE